MLLLLLLLCCAEGMAKEKPFAIEFGGGMNAGLATLSEAALMPTNNVGGEVYAEFRYRINQSPFEIGVHAAENLLLRTTSSNSTHLFFSTNLLVVGNYSKRFGKHFTGFAGMGAGVCKAHDTADIAYVNSGPGLYSYQDGGPKWTYAVMPRVGVQFWKLRLTVGYKFQEKANRHFFTTLGFSFNF